VGTRVAEPPTIRKTGPAIEGKALVHRGMTLLDEMKAVKVNVLIVEDNLINQTVLKRQLQKCGWDVSVAGNGQEALDWLRESVYWRGERDAGKEHNTHDDTRDTPLIEPEKELDIILLDVEMPIM
jgi:CheY-like chemotaxis protein